MQRSKVSCGGNRPIIANTFVKVRRVEHTSGEWIRRTSSGTINGKALKAVRNFNKRGTAPIVDDGHARTGVEKSGYVALAAILLRYADGMNGANAVAPLLMNAGLDPRDDGIFLRPETGNKLSGNVR